MASNFDITPSPRVLRMLGEIDFKPWQCFAELIDNAIDSFKTAILEDKKILKPVVEITFPTKDEFLTKSGRILIRDNGPGMSEKQLNDCVKAGYSGNDPVDKLGLFGMGFNIATARLGVKTEVWTAKVEESDWHGTSIDFDQLENSKKFTVPKLKKAKQKPDEHGTEILITKLHKERTESLLEGRMKNQLRTQLGKIYGRFMIDQNLTIRVDGVDVRPYRHCVWAENRSVKYGTEEINAIIKIDRKLEPKNFCKRCWLWIPEDEKKCENCGKTDAVAPRERRVRGWIGIQRHFDLDEYGIDFIRNGRKILIGDKSVFKWLNPDTMQEELEYPIDMVGREGGRIVGEIEIDHVRVSHQKDAFQTSDSEWQQAIKIIRGESPLRPNIAESHKLPPNESPLAKLFKGYRRGDVGTRYLVPGNEAKYGINNELKDWAKKFHAGDIDYQSDQKWYEAVLVGENAIKKDKRTSSSMTESKKVIDELLPEGKVKDTAKGKRELFKEHATKEPIMSREYSIVGLGVPPIKVDVFRVADRDKIYGEGGDKPLPALFLPELSGPSMYYYDPNHEFFSVFKYMPHEIFLLELASHIYTMLGDTNLRKKWPITIIFGDLMSNYYPAELIDYSTLSTRSQEFLRRFAEKAPEFIKQDTERAFNILSEEEVEFLTRKVAEDLRQGVDKVAELKKNGKFVGYAPFSYIPRLVRDWPEIFLDDKYWNVPYIKLSLKTEEATNKLRKEQVDRLYNMLMDAAWLVEARTPSQTAAWKETLLRARHSLNLLEIERTKDE